MRLPKFRVGLLAPSLLLVFLTASAPGQIKRVKGGYRFLTKYTAGTTTRYLTTTTAGNVGSAEHGTTIKIPLTLTVKSVTKGVAQVKVDIGQGLVNGQPYSAPQSTVIPLDALDASQINGPKFPRDPIPIGGTWKAMRPVKVNAGTAMELEGLYRFQGIKVVDGHEVAVIVFDMHGAANGSGSMLLLTSDGSIYSSLMLIKIPSKGIVPELKISMSRLAEKGIVHKPRK